MICENCKERPATVIITKGFTGESFDRHLCEKCAFQSETFNFNSNHEPLSIQQFLSHWFSGTDPFQAQEQKTDSADAQLECTGCKLTFDKFLDIGKFGCPICYETFRKRLPQVFGKLHNGQSKHTGKIPVSFNELYAIKRKIEEVRLKMQEAVNAERFEEAAILRDEAHQLQNQMATGGEEDDVN